MYIQYRQDHDAMYASVKRPNQETTFNENMAWQIFQNSDEFFFSSNEMLCEVRGILNVTTNK